jgi:hypothetical protein
MKVVPQRTLALLSEKFTALVQKSAGGRGLVRNEQRKRRSQKSPFGYWSEAKQRDLYALLGLPRPKAINNEVLTHFVKRQQDLLENEKFMNLIMATVRDMRAIETISTAQFKG